MSSRPADDEAAASERPLPWRAIGTLGTGLFGMGFAVGGYGAYVSYMVARGTPPSDAGFGMTLFLLGQFLIVFPADRFTRSTSVGRVAVVGLVIGGLGAALSAVASLPFALASRTFLGFGQGVLFIGAMKYIGRSTTRSDTATAQGLLGALFTLGLAVGIAVVPAALSAFGPMLPAVVAVAFIVVGAIGSVSLDPVHDANPRPLREYLDPFTSRVGLSLGLGNMATFGFLMVAATWYTDLLASLPSIPLAETLIGFALATVAGRGIGGWLSRSIGERDTVNVSLVGLTGLLVAIYWAIDTGNATLLAVALVGTGLGFGVPFGPLFSLAFSELADDPGVTLVGMLAIGNLGALAYPWLMGVLLADTASYALGFASLAVSVAAIWVLWHTTFRTA